MIGSIKAIDKSDKKRWRNPKLNISKPSSAKKMIIIIAAAGSLLANLIQAQIASNIRGTQKI
jgi:hypothetical protein